MFPEIVVFESRVFFAPKPKISTPMAPTSVIMLSETVSPSTTEPSPIKATLIASCRGFVKVLRAMTSPSILPPSFARTSSEWLFPKASRAFPSISTLRTS